MAKNRIYKFSSISQAESFLNGGVVGSSIPSKLVYENIVGKTLKFTSPSSVTVTFVAGAKPNGVLTFLEVKTQVEAAIVAVKVLNQSGKIVLIEATPTSGVAVDGTGTSTNIFGFGGDNHLTGKLFTPPGVTPGSQQLTGSFFSVVPGDNSVVLFTWE